LRLVCRSLFAIVDRWCYPLGPCRPPRLALASGGGWGGPLSSSRSCSTSIRSFAFARFVAAQSVPTSVHCRWGGDGFSCCLSPSPSLLLVRAVPFLGRSTLFLRGEGVVSASSISILLSSSARTGVCGLAVRGVAFGRLPIAASFLLLPPLWDGARGAPDPVVCWAPRPLAQYAIWRGCAFARSVPRHAASIALVRMVVVVGTCCPYVPFLHALETLHGPLGQRLHSRPNPS